MRGHRKTSSICQSFVSLTKPNAWINETHKIIRFASNYGIYDEVASKDAPKLFFKILRVDEVRLFSSHILYQSTYERKHIVRNAC